MGYIYVCHQTSKGSPKHKMVNSIILKSSENKGVTEILTFKNKKSHKDSLNINVISCDRTIYFFQKDVFYKHTFCCEDITTYPILQ